MLSSIDLMIIAVYFIAIFCIAIISSRYASKNLTAYNLGNKRLPWYVLGIADASGSFDITGTMFMVMIIFIYGIKGVFIFWIWNLFQIVFNMVFMSAWIRRSNAMTIADWLHTRFSNGRMTEANNILIVLFAVVGAIGAIAYTFTGIGKFATTFFPWDLSFHLGHYHVANYQAYSLLITALVGLYSAVGGLPSVVFTELLQLILMATASIAIGVLAILKVSHQQILSAVPKGWATLSFPTHLHLDWSHILPSLNDTVKNGGYHLYSIIILLLLFKGVLVSVSGSGPGYDSQRILATRSPKEASKMSGLISIVLMMPRFMLVTGISVLAVVFLTPYIQTHTGGVDFVKILPLTISKFIPVGLKGLLLAGLIAAFMSTFSANVIFSPAYLINDIYKKYINKNATQRHYVRMSYLMALLVLVCGIMLGTSIGSVAKILSWLWGVLGFAYAASNLLKWIWWRFNAIGYFGGMLAGIIIAILLPILFPKINNLYTFPFTFAIITLVSIGATFLGKPDDAEKLMHFYKTVRPWGFWKPIQQQVADEQGVKIDAHFLRDMVNCVVGTVWQTALILFAMYLVLQSHQGIIITLVITIVTSIFLYFNWWRKLED